MRTLAGYTTNLPVLLVVAVLVVSTVPATVALAQIGESEPNDGQSTATPITVDEAVEGEITSEDEDWFSLDGVQAGQSVEVSASVPTDSDGLYAYLYGPDGYTGSGQYVDPGETAELGAIAELTGTYYVRLYASGTDTGSYSFEVASSETDEYEPNENAGTAAAVSQGTQVSAEVTTGDDDWFSFDGVEAGQAITLDFEKPRTPTACGSTCTPPAPAEARAARSSTGRTSRPARRA